MINQKSCIEIESNYEMLRDEEIIQHIQHIKNKRI